MKEALILLTWKDFRLRIFAYVTMAIAIALVQTSFIYIIEIDGFTPDLLLLLIVWVVLQEGRFRGLVFAFSAGLLLDFASTGNLGVNALAKIISAFSVGFFCDIEKKKTNTHSFRFVWFVILASLINFSVFYMLNMNYLEFSWSSYFFLSIPASTIYTSVLASIFISLLPRRRY